MLSAAPRCLKIRWCKRTFARRLRGCLRSIIFRWLGNLCRGCGYESDSCRSAHRAKHRYGRAVWLSQIDCRFAGHPASVTQRPAWGVGYVSFFPYERERVQHFLRGLASTDSIESGSSHASFAPARGAHGRRSMELFSIFGHDGERVAAGALGVLRRVARPGPPHLCGLSKLGAKQHDQTVPAKPRVVVAILPASLPFDPERVWSSGGGRGVAVSIDGDSARIPGLLLQGPSSVPALLAQQDNFDASDLWLIDAESCLQSLHGDAHVAASLSWSSLLPLRDHVLERVNTVPRSIEITDQTLAAIRSEKVDAWWPREISDQPRLQRFLIDLYLSGNGALIFSNAFVQWAANEALRRARPRVLIACFGMRARPKPFTGIAIFSENQQRISALPDTNDPQGSAVDASVLARYILLGLDRYPEGAQTAFLAIAESARTAYLVAPASFRPASQLPATATPEEVAAWIRKFVSNEGES